MSGWRGPAWRVTDADPGHAGQIRRWITSVIAGHDCPVAPDDAEMLAGELFANAVMHGPALGRVLVAYCLWRDGARIVVCDGGGPGVPVLRQADDQAEGWRGLQVVDSLAARWGHFGLPGARVVWCDLGQPLRAVPSDTWAWLPLVLSVCPLSPQARPAVQPCAAAVPYRDGAGSGGMITADLAGVR